MASHTDSQQQPASESMPHDGAGVDHASPATEHSEPTGFKGFLHRYGRITVSLIAVGCIPLIYAAMLILSNLDPTGRLDQVPALIVNEDTAAEVKGESINVGDELTKKLVEDDSKKNLNWDTATAAEAKHALEHGKALAVLTIPEGFSEHLAHAAKASQKEASITDAASAHMTIQTNDSTNFIMGQIASSVQEKLTTELRSQFAKEYLENVYVSLTEINGSLTDAADGSGKVTDGANSARDASGELSSGLLRLSDGTKSLRDASGELNAGAVRLADGARTLAGGLGELKSKTASMPDAAKALDAGAGKLAKGAGTANDAIQQLFSGSKQLSSGTGELNSKITELNKRAQDLTGANDQLLAAAEKAQKDFDALRPDVTIDLDPAAKRVDGFLKDLEGSEEFQQFLKDNPKFAERFGTAQQDAAAIRSGIDSVREAAKNAGLTDGSKKPLLPEEILQKLREGNAALKKGAGELNVATGKLNDGATKLSDGLGQLAEKSPELADGAKKLKDGTKQLAQQAPELVAGIGKLNDGAGELSKGAGKLADGTGQLQAGVGKLDDGAKEAHDGSNQLHDGLGELADGSGELTDGLKDGAGKVPAFTKDEKKKLSEVNSAPVTGELERINEMANNGTGLSPYFMSLALWIGGIAFFMLLAPIPERLVRKYRGKWYSFIQMAFASYSRAAIMAIVQAAVITVVVQFIFGLEVAHPFLLWGLVTLGSLAFLAVNQGLVSLLGAPGRFLSLILIVLQIASAGGTYPWQTMPGILRDIHPYLPMTYTVEAFRSLIGGGVILGTSAAASILMGWLITGFLMLVLACFLVTRVEAVRDWATLAPGLPGGGKSSAIEGMKEEHAEIKAEAAERRARAIERQKMRLARKKAKRKVREKKKAQAAAAKAEAEAKAKAEAEADADVDA
ncbi:YhgE/Pip domain-containing protein [Pseudoglutamicibacter cumminsii]|uniref:YhgE/Pip domain-containing protein n=1 Tax=Pseudoglutamicibacter cumminsii TaxID=156979 RepID=A0ABX5L7L3_9MICC|nr:YhgE/Pip domain-containing protein [Pseudoglutamicibacter cumminsii]PWI27690.1 hypothetical protein CAY35_05620 [Pseudoglutamicibacter cumminsii]